MAAFTTYTQEEDAVRQEYLGSLSYRVVRFSNGEVLQAIDAVLNRIAEFAC